MDNYHNPEAKMIQLKTRIARKIVDKIINRFCDYDNLLSGWDNLLPEEQDTLKQKWLDIVMEEI